MECQEIEKLIPIYLDSKLEDTELQIVTEHLKTCLHCQKELTLLERSWDILSKWEDIEPDPGYVQRFWTRLPEERSWHEQFLTNLKAIFTRKKRPFAFAAASLAVIICVLTLSNYVINVNTGKVLISMNPQELELLDELELAQNLDIIENIDWLEDWDVIENLDIIESQT